MPSNFENRDASSHFLKFQFVTQHTLEGSKQILKFLARYIILHIHTCKFHSFMTPIFFRFFSFYFEPFHLHATGKCCGLQTVCIPTPHRLAVVPFLIILFFCLWMNANILIVGGKLIVFLSLLLHFVCGRNGKCKEKMLNIKYMWKIRFEQIIM